jgi:hypothetical protein
MAGSVKYGWIAESVKYGRIIESVKYGQMEESVKHGRMAQDGTRWQIWQILGDAMVQYSGTHMHMCEGVDKAA